METNKIEKHIAQKLREREIQPSDNAWERIAEQLETSEAPKAKSYFRYGIAASVIGLLIASIVVFNSGETISTVDIEVVDSEKTNDKLDKEVELPVFDESKETEVVSDAIDKITFEDTIREVAVQNIKKDNLRKQNVIKSKVESHVTLEDLAVSEALVEAKIAEVVAQADAMEQNELALTDAEVDSLLRKAQRELLTEKLLADGQSVDAMALLSEVEQELDQSFREQIFEKLKSGFLKVRTAVADRNN